MSSNQTHDSNDDIEEQKRISNLGSTMNHLRALVPTLLQKSLPKTLLSPDILLRICPSYFEKINAYLPNIKGHVSYYATCKAAQLFLTSLILNPQAHLHIESIRTSKFPDPSCLYTYSTKIFVRWSTCPEGCSHLLIPKVITNSSSGPKVDTSPGDENFSTSRAKLGSHSWSSIDPVEVLDYSKGNWSISGSIADLGKGIVGLRKDDSKLERIISGVFIFELNEANDTIMVHTIDNLNIIERTAEHNVGNKLRIC
ncbi:hypothetical protein JCM33374_g3439 [Metschnikowia sp. JCM 33374]|nr:hypothetical protein JCM33374_g3439 [Metschnikowia sp. JCM 33374]